MFLMNPDSFYTQYIFPYRDIRNSAAIPATVLVAVKMLITFWLAMQLWAEAEAVVGVKLRAGAGSEPRLTLSSADAGIQGCVRGHGFMREILTVTTQPECKSWEPVMYRVTAITHAWVLNC